MKPCRNRIFLFGFLIFLAVPAITASPAASSQWSRIRSLDHFRPQWPKRYDHRLRTAANLLFISHGLDWSTTDNQMIPTPHIDYRWSWVDWNNLPKKPQVGYALEAGNYAILINYLKVGPELRLNRNFWCSAELGAVIVSVEAPTLKSFYCVQAGLISQPISMIRFEFELGYYTTIGHNDHIFRLQIGLSSL